jgi:acyl-coenzyme A synthetase/AMP-(fatty) acid ligase
MMKLGFLPLSDLMREGRSDGYRVGLQGQAWLVWRDFRSRVVRYVGTLLKRPEQRWLLVAGDALEFASQLLALLHAGKQVVIPPNTQLALLDSMRSAFDAVLDFEPEEEVPSSFEFSRLGQGVLFLYTSGSTGMPKCIQKTLQQFEQEIVLLEKQFGSVLGDCGVFGSALPHHLYGLTFRVLWPLAAGRPLDGVTCGNPDMLVERGLAMQGGVLVSSPAQLSRWPDWISQGRLQPPPRMVFSAGGALDRRSAQWVCDTFGQSPVEIYGSSETGIIAWKTLASQDRWTPFFGVRVFADAQGAARVDSPLLAGDGVCPLDDVVEPLPDGRFLLKGRLDRTVKIEEKRLFLPDMEAFLMRHDWVQMAALVVLTGSRQVLGAAVVLSDAGRAYLLEHGKWRLSQLLRQHLALYFDRVLLPKRWRFPLQLPLNDRGKLISKALVDLFEHEN